MLYSRIKEKFIVASMAFGLFCGFAGGFLIKASTQPIIHKTDTKVETKYKNLGPDATYAEFKTVFGKPVQEGANETGQNCGIWDLNKYYILACEGEPGG